MAFMEIISVSAAPPASGQGHGVNHKNGVVGVDDMEHLNRSIALAASDDSPFAAALMHRIRSSRVTDDVRGFLGQDAVLVELRHVSVVPTKRIGHELKYMV
jgi:hypothetical protein